jgi:peptidyl-prolyl cis-trans isomerase C
MAALSPRGSVIRLVLLWLVPFALGGCRERRTGPPAEAADTIVRIDGQPVLTLAGLEEELKRQAPTIRARLANKTQLQEFVGRDLVRDELLAREARARGYDRQPDIARAIKQLLVSELIKQEVDSRLKPADIPENRIQAYHRDHQREFQRPDEVRASQIVITDQARARQAAAAARKLGHDDAAGFATLVAKYSDDVDSRTRGGDLGYLDRSSKRLPRPAVEAAFALVMVGDISPLVRSESGFHLIRLTERRPAAARAYGEVKEEIRQRLYQLEWNRRMAELVTRLQDKAKVEIFPDRLAKLGDPAEPHGR